MSYCLYRGKIELFDSIGFLVLYIIYVAGVVIWSKYFGKEDDIDLDAASLGEINEPEVQAALPEVPKKNFANSKNPLRDLLDPNAAVSPSSAVGRPRAGTNSSGKFADLEIGSPSDLNWFNPENK